MASLFAAALGPAWSDLPEPVRAFHGEGGATRFRGEAEVTRGANPLARLLATLFGFPPAGAGQPVTITIGRDAAGEVWRREFGGHRMASRLAPAGPGRVAERIGPAVFVLALAPSRDGLGIAVESGRLLGLPLPRLLLPHAGAHEAADAA